MTLVAERLYILGCLAGDPHKSFIYDASLRSEVRHLLSGLETNEDEERGRLAKELASLYETYGPGVWKCILEFSFLLHTTSEAPQLFAAILSRLELDMHASATLARELINELGWYARTPYDFTYELVNLSLERLSKCGGIIVELIENINADPTLRLAAARQVVETHNQTAYPSVLKFFAESSVQPTAESYSRIVSPLIQLYTRTGSAGMLMAVAAFERDELGPQGPHLLASFRSDFPHWFLSQPPRASIKWTKVLLKAWRRADSLVDRNNLLSLLIEDWCSDSSIAEFARSKLQQSLRVNRTYLSPASRDLKAKVLWFAMPRSGEAGKDFEKSLKAALEGSDEKWKTRRKSIPLDRATGTFAASAYISSPEEIQRRILSWVEGSKRQSGFQRAFFQRLIRPDVYKKVASKGQLRLITSPEFVVNVTSEELDQILLNVHTLEEEVKSKLKDTMLLVLRQSNLDGFVVGRDF
jgi:hypothetical protein